MNQIKKENKDLKKENDSLKKENAKIKLDLQNLTLRVEEIETNINIKKIEVVGIPESDNEDLKTLGNKIKKLVNIDDDLIQIENIERTKYGRRNQRNIIIKLKTKEERDHFLKKAKSGKNNLMLKNLDDKFDNSKFYINELLSKEKKELLKTVKILKNDYEIKYVWVNNGEILTRKKDKEKVIVIKSINDLQKPK